jgi:hypothetical protein
VSCRVEIETRLPDNELPLAEPSVFEEADIFQECVMVTNKGAQTASQVGSGFYKWPDRSLPVFFGTNVLHKRFFR